MQEGGGTGGAYNVVVKRPAAAGQTSAGKGSSVRRLGEMLMSIEVISQPPGPPNVTPGQLQHAAEQQVLLQTPLQPKAAWVAHVSTDAAPPSRDVRCKYLVPSRSIAANSFAAAEAARRRRSVRHAPRISAQNDRKR